MSLAPVRVGVLVNLEQHPAAGGHVKCWERLAEAARGLDGLDLTVYTLGRRQTIVLAENVRFEVVPGVLNTRSLVILKHGGGHADIAPYHPRLGRMLAAHDVLHSTRCLQFRRHRRQDREAAGHGAGLLGAHRAPAARTHLYPRDRRPPVRPRLGEPAANRKAGRRRARRPRHRAPSRKPARSRRSRAGRAARGFAFFREGQDQR